MRNVITIALLCMINGMIYAQEWTTPIIEGYGRIKQFKDVAAQPDTSLEYNIVFDVKDDRELDGVNIGLFKIARLINMLGTGGVPQDKIHIVAAVHGGATFAALNDQKYKEKYNKANPNTELLQLLHDYGVEIYVCAQATASRGITADDLDANTELGLSAMMVLANYELKGYALMP
ncbi:DsrE family protein [Maribacter thermophilus]|uniref:DsrE family protein n=1 Tax=Maribacter thermophilus TaxID=1197874 RepID=UPI000640D900|nr:DsrE family protein [Maribacter thermophilus]